MKAKIEWKNARFQDYGKPFIFLKGSLWIEEYDEMEEKIHAISKLLNIFCKNGRLDEEGNVQCGAFFNSDDGRTIKIGSGDKAWINDILKNGMNPDHLADLLQTLEFVLDHASKHGEEISCGTCHLKKNGICMDCLEKKLGPCKMKWEMAIVADLPCGKNDDDDRSILERSSSWQEFVLFKIVSYKNFLLENESK